LGKVLALLDQYNARIIGRVWVKEPGKALKPTSTYSYAIQDIGRHFQHLLSLTGDDGLIICDSRAARQDVGVSHSIFTQKHQAGGDSYPSLVDTVVFGRSDNHVGLQLADTVAAGLVFPLAVAAYQAGTLTAHRKRTAFNELRKVHGPALKKLKYTYLDSGSSIRGGIVVSDPVGHFPSGLLFG
jgi:hypothetical protein